MQSYLTDLFLKEQNKKNNNVNGLKMKLIWRQLYRTTITHFMKMAGNTKLMNLQSSNANSCLPSELTYFFWYLSHGNVYA